MYEESPSSNKICCAGAIIAINFRISIAILNKKIYVAARNIQKFAQSISKNQTTQLQKSKKYMKKTFSLSQILRHAALTVVALAACAGLGACTDDDDDDGEEFPTEMLGSWEATRQSITMNVEGLEPETTYNENPRHRLNIRADFTIESQSIDPQNGTWVRDYLGQWAYNSYYGILVVAPSEDERLVYNVASLDNSRMVLVYTENGETPEGTPCVYSYATSYRRMQTN